MAGMLYEVMKKNLKPKLRPKLHENFRDLMQGLQTFTETGENIIPKYGPLNFAKHDFNVPEFTADLEAHEVSEDELEVLKRKVTSLKKKVKGKEDKKEIKVSNYNDQPVYPAK